MKTRSAGENLITAVSRRINKIGFVSYSIGGDYTTMQFIDNYLKSLIGPDCFYEENYELVTTKNGVSIMVKENGNYSKGHNITIECKRFDEVSSELECLSLGDLKGNVLVLTNSISPEKTLYLVADLKKHATHALSKRGSISDAFSVSDDNDYGYSFFSNNELVYSGVYKGMNASIKNREYFEYIQEFPTDDTVKKGISSVIEKFKSLGNIRVIEKRSEYSAMYDNINLVLNSLVLERDNYLMRENRKESKKSK